MSVDFLSVFFSSFFSLRCRFSCQVLDVGCGIGGGDFLMAREYKVSVLGVDLSQNMLSIAAERAVLPENGEGHVAPARSVLFCYAM